MPVAPIWSLLGTHVDQMGAHGRKMSSVYTDGGYTEKGRIAEGNGRATQRNREQLRTDGSIAALKREGDPNEGQVEDEREQTAH